MTDWEDLPDLAAERLGGRVLAANDEFFAEKENLLKAAAAIFVPDRYTDQGKWMDGWETRRRRTPGFDWAVVRLGLPGILRGAVVDTAFFTGNYPEACALEACALERDPDEAERAATGAPWIELLPRTPLAGDTANRFTLTTPHRFTHVRLNIFPDGGVARLRLHGEPLPRWPALPATLDLGDLAHGAFVVAWSDRFFGPPHKLGLPDAPRGMHDGWETRRRRGPGHDWVVVRLAAEGVVEAVTVDTTFFKGNAPGSCTLEGCVARDAVPPADAAWETLVAATPLQPDRPHALTPARRIPVTHVRLNIFPDGGVARLRLFGAATAEGRARATLRWLDALPAAAAEEELLACCASRRWARAVAAARPFRDAAALVAAGERAADLLAAADWLEAFAAHPRLGERPAAEGRHEEWSRDEQRRLAEADASSRQRLAAANRAYEARFGHVFLFCATGQPVEAMLAACEARLGNERQAELVVAAAEQRKITALRLHKLLQGPPP